MKKQLFIVALTVLAIPAVVFAPAIGGGSRSVSVNNAGNDAMPAGSGKAASTTITTAADLVAAFPGSEADLVAGAVAASGVTGGQSGSKAGLAAQQFVKTGTATVNASGAQSKALGRLGRK